jgi:hypothetical protein
MVEYFPLVAFSVGRRPYTTEAEAKLLVTLDRSVKTAAATATLAHPAVAVRQAVALVDRSSVLSFSLAALPGDIDTVVTLAVELTTEDGPPRHRPWRRRSRFPASRSTSYGE